MGENELDTIQSCLAFVDAEQEYYLRNVQKDPLQHYANKLISSPGKKDGLYWPATADEPPEPARRGIRRGASRGLSETRRAQGLAVSRLRLPDAESQGPQAPGGAYEYTVNGEMLGGFALIAIPAEYGSSGVMTFIVNHDGVVYSRDLGPHTKDVALGIVEFNPDSMWKKEDGSVVAAQ